MAVRIHLNDGVELRVEIDVETMTDAYENALENNKVLEIQSGDGTVRRVNPRQVLYFEEETPDQREALEAPSSDPQGAPA